MSNYNETWKILESIKKRYGYTSDTELAGKFGVTLSALRKWRSRDKIPNKINLKISDLKEFQNSFNQNGNNNISNLNIGGGEGSNLNTKNADIDEIIELINNYSTPKLLDEIKQKLLKIKEISEN